MIVCRSHAEKSKYMSQSGFRGQFNPSSAKDLIAESDYLERVQTMMDLDKKGKNKNVLKFDRRLRGSPMSGAHTPVAILPNHQKSV